MPLSPRPTDAELEILRVLWRRGPSTVREVLGDLGREEQPGYTTVLKLLQIMTDKGLVLRDEPGRAPQDRAHVYRPALAEEETQMQLVSHLLDRAFGGSAAKLVMRALSTRPASGDELTAIRLLLDEVEARRDPS
jgi:BlaI family transcriptional regulator, penicillinase repressor